MRDGLAVVDARTGAVSPIAFTSGGTIDALEHAGNRMYMGGINAGLVALDTTTGVPLPWEPGPTGWPSAIEARGDKVYVASGSVRELSASDGPILRSFQVDSAHTRDLAIAGHVLLAGGGCDARIAGVSSNWFHPAVRQRARQARARALHRRRLPGGRRQASARPGRGRRRDGAGCVTR